MIFDNIKKITVTCILMTVVCANSFSQNAVQAKAEELYGGDFSDCSFAVMAMTDDGTPIAHINEKRLMNPASNMKVLTTGAALMCLGENFRWSTTLSYSGNIDSLGVLHGDLYIIGGGDPFLGSKKGRTLEEDFAAWMKMMRSAGITSIDGAIIGDGSWIEGMKEEPSWSYMDLGTYYGTCVSGLNFYENQQDFKVKGGAQKDLPLAMIEPSYPETPWMEWEFQCSTGGPKSGDKLYLYMDQGDNKGTIRGTYGCDNGMKTVHFRNNLPEYTAAHSFVRFLDDGGLKVSKGAEGMKGERPAGLTELGTYASLPLRDVVRETNRNSNNFCAEIIFRTLGKKLKGHSDCESSRQALSDALARYCRIAPDRHRLNIQDGSGLSVKNRLTAELMCEFLRTMMNSSTFSTFKSSLVKEKDRVFLKTGSFSSCRALCGYITPSSEGGRTIIFSIMVNNSPYSVHTINIKEKQLIELLLLQN